MPVNPKVYIETSVVSYLTAWPSRDLVRAAHQQVTRDWWATRRSFDLFTVSSHRSALLLLPGCV